jgi:hypothetical protein
MIMGRPKPETRGKSKEDKECDASLDKSLSQDDGDEQSDFTKNLAAALQAPAISQQFNLIFNDQCNKILKPLISEEVASQLAPLTEKLDGLELDHQCKIAQNTKDVKKCDLRYDDINNRLLSIERSNKSCNLIIVGLPNLPPRTANTEVNDKEKQDEAAAPSYTSASNAQGRIISQVIGVLQQAGLKDIHTDQVSSIHTIKAPGQPNKILAKLKSEHYKINIFRQKKLLKSLPFKVFINEDLTKEDGKIYRIARKRVKDGILHSVWSKGGIIYAKTSDKGSPFEVKDL